LEFDSILYPIAYSVSSATSGGILDRAVEAEDKKHGDLLRLVVLFSFSEFNYPSLTTS
jgi:hypothetical protein